MDQRLLFEEALRAAKAKRGKYAGVQILRRSIDARRGKVRVALQVALLPHGQSPQSSYIKPVDLSPLTGCPQVSIVGAGPAGMFCAWELARLGLRPVILDRGKKVRERRKDLANLSQRGELNEESNYCFGEGGAGTFSDGKLYTRANKRGEVRRVLEALVGYGASSDILVNARPHIGTNRLPAVIGAMREHLESAGVEFRFDSRIDDLSVSDGRVTGVVQADGTKIQTPYVVMAPGHSARDVFRWLHAAGVPMSFKPFAIGVRVEHSQASIDEMQYGKLAGHPALGSANYRLVERAGDIGVFSFCMCPGGFIVPAATEPSCQVVNGWSPSSRRGKFANSGFVAEVSAELLAKEGFDPAKPMDGIEFQRQFEQRAYRAGGGKYVAPAQRLSDFVANTISTELPECTYPRGLQPASLDEILGPLAPAIRSALIQVDEKIPGFAGSQAVAVGVESRTSCPLRIERDRETLQSPAITGLYPCAEGAGYAGGIMSAALDGIRVAQQIARAQGIQVSTPNEHSNKQA